MEWRSHGFIKLVYVLRGSGTFYFQRKNFAFATADTVVVPPGTPNRIEDDPGAACSLYVCCVHTSLLQFDPRLVQRLRIARVTGDGHFANRIASLLRQMVHAQRRLEASRSIALVADALRLIQMVIERAERRPSTTPRSAERERVRRYVRELETSFFDATTIEDAAETVGMSRRTFTKLFAEEAGQSWLHTVRRLAIEHAQQQLRESELPIASVAFECGFNDLSTFYRQFKSHCGLSPAKYRKAARS